MPNRVVVEIIALGGRGQTGRGGAGECADPGRTGAVDLLVGETHAGAVILRRHCEECGNIKLDVRRDDGMGGMISGDTGISGLPGQYASPFGTLFLFLVRTGRGP